MFHVHFKLASHQSLTRLPIALFVASIVSRSAVAQLPTPRLTAIFPPGGQSGTAVDVTLAAGSDLDEAHQLLFSHSGITATQKTIDPAPYQTGPQPAPGQFQLAIAADVPAGVYEVRSVGYFGVSTPRAFVVGDHPELNEAEPNNEFSQAQALAENAVVNGTADGEAPDLFQFEGKSGQTVVIDCWAYRIDSRMDATLVVLNAAGKELTRSRDEAGLDPRIAFRVPADGRYFVQVFDYTYQAGNEHFYRLSVRGAPHVECVFPLAGMPGTTQSFTLYGYNLPGGVAGADPRTGKQSLERLTVEIPVPTVEQLAESRELGGLIESQTASVDQFVFRLPSPHGVSNPVRIGLATSTVLLESLAPNDTRDEAQLITLPSEVSGQFFPGRDVDWYAFEAKSGQTYWIEVIAARLGRPVDADLIIEGGGGKSADSGDGAPGRRGRRNRRRNPAPETQGDGLQVFDDTQPEIGGVAFRTASSDPVVAWTAPKDGVHRISVRDLFAAGKGDPRHGYRLSIRPAQPDFQLVAALRQPAKDDQQLAPWSMVLRKGGANAIRLLAMRRDGFDGPIQVGVEGVPPGVSCPPVTIGAGESSVYLPFSAAEDAASFAGEVRIVGRAKIGEHEVARLARGGDLLFATQQNESSKARPRVTARTVLAVVGDSVPWSVASGAPQPLESSRNGKLSIPISVARRDEFKGNVVVRPQLLPREMQLGEVTVPGDQTTATMELSLTPNAPLGEFTIPLQSETTFPYRRNPEAAARAEAEKQVAEKLSTEATASVASMEQSRQAAESKLSEANAALAASQQALAAAEQTLTAAAEADRIAAQTARDAARSAVLDATARVAQATAEREAAAQTAADAAARAQAAEQFKKTATDRAAETAKAAEAKDVNVLGSAGAITIRVAAAPVSLTLAAPTEPLRPGRTLELPVQLARLYGFADAVELEPSFPATPSGVSAEKTGVAADKSEGMIVLTATGEPAAGEHELLVRAKFKFNDQEMQVEQTLKFTVETVAK